MDSEKTLHFYRSEFYFKLSKLLLSGFQKCFKIQSNFIWLFVKIDVKIPHPRKSYPLWISISSLLLNFTLQHITTGKDKVIYRCKNRNNPICLQMKWFFVFLFFPSQTTLIPEKGEKHAAFIIQSKSLWTADYSWILKWRA